MVAVEAQASSLGASQEKFELNFLRSHGREHNTERKNICAKTLIGYQIRRVPVSLIRYAQAGAKQTIDRDSLPRGRDH
jgi:hypothetical protein